MSINTLSVIIVDDTEFSKRVTSKRLASKGITRIREAKSGAEALALHKRQPADCIIADWVMPKMSGLELAKEVRKIDLLSNHYTYIILHSAREGVDFMSKAFDAGIDDFVSKSSSSELLPRLHGAVRAQRNYNTWKQENNKLKRSLNKHREFISLDPTTGLANLKTAQHHLHSSIQHYDNRGGSLSLLLVKLTNYESLKSEHPNKVIYELISNAGRRFQQLVRPVDFLARISSSEFLWVGNEPNSVEVDLNGLKRIADGIAIKAYETRGGFLRLKTASAATKIDFDQLEIKKGDNTYFDQIISHLRNRLVHSKVSGRLDTSEWPSSAHHLLA